MDFDRMMVDKEEHISTVQATLVHLIETPNEGKVKVKSAFFPICPI